MNTYTISELVYRLEHHKLSLSDVLEIRKLLKRPFKKHPLGFYSCVLLEEGSQKIRLHYWDTPSTTDTQSSELMIHDHIFDFKSWIMLGAVENIQYKQNDNGEEFCIYSGYYEENYSILEKTSKQVFIKKCSNKIFKKGESYTMSAGCLHETKPLENLVFTILHTRNTDIKIPLVLGPVESGNSKYIYERTTIDEIDIMKLLSRTIINN